MAQPESLWFNTYGGGNNDWCRAHAQTADGGFILAGETSSFGNLGGSDLYVVRTDADGQVIWANTYGTQWNDVGADIIQMSDGGFAIAGNYENHQMDIFIAKIAANGDMEWQSNAVSNDYDEVSAIIETTGGGVAIIGRTNSDGQWAWRTGFTDFLFLRWSANGQFGGFPDNSHSRMYGVANTGAFGRDIVQTSDGGFALSGTLQPGDGNTADFWLIKTDANGDIEWDQTYGGNDADENEAVIQTSDDGFALTGMTKSFGVNGTATYLVKTDAQGQLSWENHFGGGQNDAELSYSLVQTFAGAHSVAGGFALSGWNGRPLLRATDEDGQSLWMWEPPEAQQTVGFGETVTQSANGEFAISGMLLDQNNGDQNFFLSQTGNAFDGYNDFVQTQDDQTILITAANFDNQPVPTGWEIGLFTPNAVQSGGGVWTDGQQLGLAAFGDDDQTQAVEGFVAGEEISFRLWDSNANIEYPAVAVVSQGDLVWQDGNAAALELYGYLIYTMDLILAANWNMISVNVVPPPAYWTGIQGPDVPLMMQQFIVNNQNHLILMKDEHGHFYWPALNFNNIAFWDLTRGYKVRMDQQMQGSWTGAQIPSSTDIPITPGWNIIAYYPTYTLSADQNTNPPFHVIDPIVNNVLMAKNSHGQFMIPNNINPFSNMPNWEEGQGYQIKVDANVVLNYPAHDNNIDAVEHESLPATNHWSEPANTGSNMSLLVTSIRGQSVENGDQIAAFDAKGTLVGVGTVDNDVCGLAVWGDDLSTEAIDGLQNGESFSLRLWSDNGEFALETLVQQGSLTYTADGFTDLTAIASANVPKEFYLSQSYPNPFNSTTRIAFGLPEATRINVSVFDMTGRLVATLADGSFAAGSHSSVWNADTSPAGLYVVKMEAGSFNDARKITLVK